MKTILSFIAILCITSVTAIAQTVDLSQFAPLEVVVTNFEGVAQQGERILFQAVNSDLIYSGTSNAEGKFDLYLKGGETYLIKIKAIGKEEEYSKVTVPAPQEGQQYVKGSLSIKFEPARTFTLDNVTFDTGKATLTRSSYEEINELLAYMQLKKDLTIEIAGHTDNVGDETSNMALSEKRANAVRAYLISKGIAPERVVAKGYGESQPIESNDTAIGRQANRRTEVRVVE